MSLSKKKMTRIFFVMNKIYRGMPNNWWGMQNAAPIKYDQKLSEAAFSAVFLTFDKCRFEVAGDVMSVGHMGPDVPNNRAKLGDPRLNLRVNLSREINPGAS